ncbi:MAG: hypothetical protein B6241_15155 [Spirochaetaceae bacterium 4572_59]|nr:MAG: hypothetical protein B6241_15155 [Spirochaetaceae bacterium 4572_59]
MQQLFRIRHLERIVHNPYNLKDMPDTNYEFLDCGNGRRLERFGEITVDRPAPQAEFPHKLSSTHWEEADARFLREEKESRWEFMKTDRKEIEKEFCFISGGIRMDLKFSENGQIGIYPEQKENWNWIKEQTGKAEKPLRVLNGFAYTGGSTLFASRGGINGQTVDVCHLDASKSAVNWARKNAAASGLQDQTIRYVVEDIIRFMERQVKRGNSYQGIVLDPPAFGRAPGKKTWVLKRDLHTLMDLCRELFREDPRFILISCHDPEISKEMLADQLSRFGMISPGKISIKDLVIPSKNGNSLPNGIAARWSRD